MLRILVTGGAGYIGSVCSAKLIDEGHVVTVIDNLSTGHRSAVPPEADFVEADITDRRSIASLVRRTSFDVVFHFAAKALIAESVVNPGVFFAENTAGGIGFFEELRSAKIRHLIFSSTAAVYGNPELVPILEHHKTSPVNAYGESKLMLERALQWYARSYGWSVVAFRYFNACGSTGTLGEMHEPETHIIPLLLQAANGKSSRFEIYGTDYDTPDGTCVRDYVHVADIADAHVRALEHMKPSTFAAYNIGTGRTHSVREVCAAVEQVTGKKLNLITAARRPGDPAVLWADARLLERDFSWRPRHSDLLNIIRSAWQWEVVGRQRLYSARQTPCDEVAR